MVGLLDMAPSQKTETIRGKALPVTGITLAGIARIMGQFKEVERLFTGKSKPEDWTAASLMKLVPDAVSEIIAAGLGFPGNAAQIKAAETLTLGEQLSLVTAILEVTMPQGIGPFVEKLSGLLSASGMKAPATK